MQCTHPLAAWYTLKPDDQGKHAITFTFSEADTSRPITVPCRQCTACRLHRSANWATRLMHETRSHKHNWFATLTYDNATLPVTPTGLPTLRPEDFTLFMKRLRRRIDDESGDRLRFYQCGEYGERTLRPHHHAIFFGLNLPDREPVSTRAGAHARYFTSQLLEESWKQGRVILGSVTFESAQYVAGYVTKKITGPMADQHYQGRVPEYATMSRKPGIGRLFLAKYLSDIYPSDEVTVIGKTATRRPPEYYDRALQQLDPDLHEEVIETRRATVIPIRTHRQLQALDAKLQTRCKLYRKKEPGD